MSHRPTRNARWSIGRKENNSDSEGKERCQKTLLLRKRLSKKTVGRQTSKSENGKQDRTTNAPTRERQSL